MKTFVVVLSLDGLYLMTSTSVIHARGRILAAFKAVDKD
jgi:hypothetical protein